MPETIQMTPGGSEVRRRRGRAGREAEGESASQERERERRKRLAEQAVIDLKAEKEVPEVKAEEKPNADTEMVKAIREKIEGQESLRKESDKGKASRVKKMAGAMGKGAAFGGIVAGGATYGFIDTFGRLWSHTLLRFKLLLDDPGKFFSSIGEKYKEEIKEHGWKGAFKATEWLFLGDRTKLPEEGKKEK